MRFTLSGLTLLLAIVGCGGPPPLAPQQPPGSGVSNDANRTISVLDSPFVLVPRAVNVGLSFDVTIWATIGGCYDDAGTDVVADSAAATLTPYNFDSRRDSGVICPDWLRTATRVARVRFTHVGVDTITVHGYLGGPSAPPGLGSIVRTVMVEPSP